jgi:glucosamine--fructose-6-phosphate aminotransferase (isomerizing)
MCGIVGYVGHRDSMGFLLEGLRRLEYRGYDSAGIAALVDGEFRICKSAGRIDALAEKLQSEPFEAHIGVGHTRWATHGPATYDNAHPHLGGSDELVVVHNGVIENFQTLKDGLLARGYHFRSATDTEVIAHLIANCLHEQPLYDRDAGDDEAHEGEPNPYGTRRLVNAVREALSQLRGTHGLVVMFRNRPDLLIAARLGSPLVLGRRDPPRPWSCGS